MDNEAPSPETVARFLTENPDWLASQAGLYDRLSPPRRVHGEALADHMAAMIEAARSQARRVLEAGRATLGLSERVRAAVLALIREPETPSWVGDWVSGDLPRLLGLDAARLCVESGRQAPGWQAVPTGTVARLLGGRDVVVRREARGVDAVLLHGEAAGLAVHDALLRVPMRGPPMLLALATRDATLLDGDETALGFLASALAARIEAG